MGYDKPFTFDIEETSEKKQVKDEKWIFVFMFVLKYDLCSNA